MLVYVINFSADDTKKEQFMHNATDDYNTVAYVVREKMKNLGIISIDVFCVTIIAHPSHIHRGS